MIIFLALIATNTSWTVYNIIFVSKFLVQQNEEDQDELYALYIEKYSEVLTYIILLMVAIIYLILDFFNYDAASSIVVFHFAINLCWYLFYHYPYMTEADFELFNRYYKN